ncbi:unnamed protein product [Calypogeia fissa]
MGKEPVRVLITCAAGQIGYALAPLIARGLTLGLDQPVILRLLDIPPAAESLNGVKVELIDAAYPLLKVLLSWSEVLPRKEGVEHNDVMAKNIYKSQVSALEQHASKDVKIAERLNIPASTVKNAIIWGNHSSSQYPDVHHAVTSTAEGDKPVRREIKGFAINDFSRKKLDATAEELIEEKALAYTSIKELPPERYPTLLF